MALLTLSNGHDQLIPFPDQILLLFAQLLAFIMHSLELLLVEVQVLVGLIQLAFES